MQLSMLDKTIFAWRTVVQARWEDHLDMLDDAIYRHFYYHLLLDNPFHRNLMVRMRKQKR
jgi:hypothetical protein